MPNVEGVQPANRGCLGVGALFEPDPLVLVGHVDFATAVNPNGF